LLGVVERVDDHVVVQHLGLGSAVDRVQLVFPLGIGVGSNLVESLSVFVAHQDDGGDDDQDRDDGRECCDQSNSASVHVLFLVHFHHRSVRQNLASLSGITGQTSALEVVFPVDAESVVHARRRVAFVDFDGAILSGKSGFASANEVIDRVVAGSAVLARVSAAVVDVLFAVCSDESGSAVALVVGDKVDAGSPVLAGIDFAVVDVVVAVLAGKSDRASAHVIGSVFGQRTGGSVGAG